MKTFHANGIFDSRFKFTAREYQPAFGLYEYRNRAYHPGLGRFLSEDPLGFATGDTNLFRYCGGDPVNGTDPFGLEVMKKRDSNDYGNSNAVGTGQGFSTQGFWSNPDGTPTGVGNFGIDTTNQGGGRNSGGSGGSSGSSGTSSAGSSSGGSGFSTGYVDIYAEINGSLSVIVEGWWGSPPSYLQGNLGFQLITISLGINGNASLASAISGGAITPMRMAQAPKM